MKSYRLYFFCFLFVLVTLVALEYGRNSQWHSDLVIASSIHESTETQNQELSHQTDPHKIWLPFISKKNGRSYLPVIMDAVFNSPPPTQTPSPPPPITPTTTPAPYSGAPTATPTIIPYPDP